LDWLFNNRENYSDTLDLVVQIYSNFDYPENIAEFIRYMPSDDLDLGSLELNEGRLYEKWKEYLEHEKDRFSS
jgi:hypothetical protein